MKQSKNKKTKSGWRKLAENKGVYIALFSVLMMVGFYVYARNMQTSLENDVVSFDEQAWQEAVTESGIEVIDVDEKNEKENKPQPQPAKEKKTETIIESSHEAVETTAEREPEFAMIVPCEGEVIAACSLEELVYCAATEDWRTHNGVDIAALEGDSVKAVESGVISKVYEDELLGVVVELKHQNGISTLYGNLQSVDFISAGTEVSRGDIIGGVGKTGAANANSEPHLHFEVMVNGEHTNPTEYIKF